jgi:hypothetical protein
MAQHQTDSSVLKHISDLVAEEQALYARPEVDDRAKLRLDALKWNWISAGICSASAVRYGSSTKTLTRPKSGRRRWSKTTSSKAGTT